jgi:hypothetical protein
MRRSERFGDVIGILIGLGMTAPGAFVLLSPLIGFNPPIPKSLHSIAIPFGEILKQGVSSD